LKPIRSVSGEPSAFVVGGVQLTTAPLLPAAFAANTLAVSHNPTIRDEACVMKILLMEKTRGLELRLYIRTEHAAE
jgi:hypothetical protein